MAIARFFSRLGKRPDVLQLHLIDDERDIFQLAQKTFVAPRNTPGDKLAWYSEMCGKSHIQRPRSELYVPGDRGFIRLKERGDFGPSFLVDAG